MNSILVVMFSLANCWASGMGVYSRSSPKFSGMYRGNLMDFGYNGDKKVPNYCNGSSQLPIDLDDSKMRATSDPDFLKFGGHPSSKQPHCSEYPTCYVHGELSNSDYTVIYHPYFVQDVQMILGKNVYSLDHIHFHWGSSDDRGSEHTINGRAYPLEMHLEFIDRTRERRPAVFSVLFEVANQNYMNLFDDELEKIINPGDNVMTYINLNFLKAFENDKFYHYIGSKPYQTCGNNDVDFLVAKNPLSISAKTLWKLRQLKDSYGDPLVDNFRPIGPLLPNADPHSRPHVHNYRSKFENFTNVSAIHDNVQESV